MPSLDQLIKKHHQLIISDYLIFSRATIHSLWSFLPYAAVSNERIIKVSPHPTKVQDTNILNTVLTTIFPVAKKSRIENINYMTTEWSTEKIQPISGTSPVVLNMRLITRVITMRYHFSGIIVDYSCPGSLRSLLSTIARLCGQGKL
jgi:hypothetical protein